MMSSRVTPNEAPVHGDQEMPISIQPTTNDNSFVVNIQEQENVNEELREIDEIYSPLLKLMKLFGIYFGDASLKCLENTSGRCKKGTLIPRIYCGVVVSGFWLNVIMAFSGIFFANDIYLFLMISFWTLFIALNGTMSLVLLRSAGMKNSRFQNFLLGLLSVIKNVKLGKAKAKSKKGLIVFRLFLIFFVATIVASEILNINIGTNKPWNRWFGVRVISPIFLVIGSGVWLLPIIFLCITCLVLEEVIDDLHKRMSSTHSISTDIAALKIEYHRLCEVVVLADKMLSPLLFEMVSLYIPLLCFGLYNVVNLHEENWVLFLLGNLMWVLVASGILAVVLSFGSRVSEKVLKINLNYVTTLILC